MSDNEATVKRKAKDSVFTDLFGDVENVLELYKALHPEDADVETKDIDIQTIKSVLVNTLYNDLGFLVKGKLVMLVEAQSVWNPNIPLRMLFYLSETYRRYLNDSVQSEHSETRVTLPKPELYVVYSGDKEVPEYVSLDEDFFGGKSSVDVRVKILNKIDKTICGQYIGFCKVYNEQRKLHSNSIECIKETIRICLERGYLVGYLESHEKEVITMMDELFDEEALRKAYDKAKAKQEFENGLEKGREKEREEMIKNLRRLGISEDILQKAAAQSAASAQ